MFTHVRWDALLRVGLLGIGLLAAPTWAAPAATPAGTWLTENGHGVITIAQCGDALCGRIVGIDRAPTEAMPTDVQGRPQCGLTIITDEKPQPDGTWLGEVTDPRDGNSYRAELWLARRPASEGLYRHPSARFRPDMAPVHGPSDRRMRCGVRCRNSKEENNNVAQAVSCRAPRPSA